jgi:hypothetical protein
MLGYAPIVSRATHRSRHLRLESLEPRAMLSHPAVAAVNVAGTQWAPGFVSYLESQGLGAGGYAIPVGSSNQLQTVPWTNVDRICITFSEDVTIAAADLSVSGANTAAYAFSDFAYDSSTHVATWTLTAPITKDKLLLDLDADGMAPVKSVATNEVLDGAWTNCQSTYPSGNGQGGTDFEFRINALPGDAISNSVNVTDASQVHQQIGQNAGDAGYNVRYDIDGSGAITSNDENLVRARIGNILPSANPVGMTDDAPTTSGISNVSVAAGTTDYLMSLPSFFADAETAAADLAYAVVQNTNPSLFNSLNINASKQLDLSFASGIKGNANLTIRATDPAGLFADTTFSVHVSDAPYITNFYCTSEYGDYWTLSGTVGDDDDPVAGDVITFGGVFANYHITATADIDGVFEFTVELPGLAGGTGTAQTQDPHGVLSNLAEDWIIV